MPDPSYQERNDASTVYCTQNNSHPRTFFLAEFNDDGESANVYDSRHTFVSRCGRHIPTYTYVPFWFCMPPSTSGKQARKFVAGYVLSCMVSYGYRRQGVCQCFCSFASMHYSVLCLSFVVCVCNITKARLIVLGSESPSLGLLV